MNITCSICAELFKNTDAENVNITRCGHVFHSVCLIKWLERAQTCPECRTKTTKSSLVRVYYNISSMNDSSIIQEYADTKMVELQNENDNLKFQLLEKNGVIASKEKSIQQLNKETETLKANNVKSRAKVTDLEQKIEGFGVIEKQYVQTITRLNAEVMRSVKLQADLTKVKKEIGNMQSIKQILVGTKAETEKILSENRSIESLATTVTVLKQQLKLEGEKHLNLRNKNRELEHKVQLYKKEKSELEEKISILASNLYQVETNLKQLQDKINPDEKEKSIIGLPESIADGSIAIKKPDSPFLKVKSSSVAGLARLSQPGSLKRQPMPITMGSQYTIFKKPRVCTVTHTLAPILKPSIFPSN